SKYKGNPEKLLKYGVIRLATIFLAIASLAYLLGLSSWVINSILILMAIIIAIFVLFTKFMYRKNIN
ncbi:MAG: hypothetical protein ACRC3Y_10540, partial [Romboutsia sp.]|uniref:hypothetical protein n=1 Tax=Romboutsia sp. TaxID=1965302 RepID=UPI003F3F1D98